MLSVILKSIASWKILAPAIIVVMVTWLIISGVVSISFVRATGKVVQLVQKGSGDDAYYCPITVFQDAAGIEHTIHQAAVTHHDFLLAAQFQFFTDLRIQKLV
jgi:hypothetical protein